MKSTLAVYGNPAGHLKSSQGAVEFLKTFCVATIMELLRRGDMLDTNVLKTEEESTELHDRNFK